MVMMIREMEIREEGREEGRKEGREEGREEGRKEGREEGIILGTIETMREDGKTDSEILKRLRDRYQLSEAVAQEYLNQVEK